MIYERIAPTHSLSDYIKSFWIVDSENDMVVRKQKIIPDGHPELIFHYGDPYRVNISGTWETQANSLLSGQIRNHFYLENTGNSGMIGIKLMPTTLTKLFGLNMSTFTDNVVALSSLTSEIRQLSTLPKPSLETKEQFIQAFEGVISNQLSTKKIESTEIDVAVDELQASHGSVSITELCKKTGISERQLERQFSKYIGLSPKFYARIMRLGYIFELMQNQDNSWADLVYQSGFYDQSHFIKNFKEFTGEDPSAYGFSERNMANFHLKK